MATLKKQAVILTAANAYTRLLGFLLRLITARMMGAQALGVMEMASTGVMLAITPVTAGIPTAMSRLTARPGADGQAVLRTGLQLVIRLSLLVTLLSLLASPLIAFLMGEPDTLLTMLLSTPGVLLLGVCAVCSGYFYGLGDAKTPAFAECAEQTVRVGLTFLLLALIKRRSTALTAALPCVAQVAAGVVVVLIFARKIPRTRRKPDPAIRRELIALTAPTTGTRLCQTALRSLNAVLLPACLRFSGLSAEAATAQFGLLGGMVMPMLMLPGVVTGAICMVAGPAVARREGRTDEVRRLARQLLLCAGGIGLIAGIGLFTLAEVIGNGLYHQSQVAPLLRLMSPCAALMAVTQVQSGVITGLGLQRRMLTGTLIASLLTLIVTAALCPMPGIRLFGAALGSMAGSALRLVWNQILLQHAIASGAKV